MASDQRSVSVSRSPTTASSVWSTFGQSRDSEQGHGAPRGTFQHWDCFQMKTLLQGSKLSWTPAQLTSLNLSSSPMSRGQVDYTYG